MTKSLDHRTASMICVCLVAFVCMSILPSCQANYHVNTKRLKTYWPPKDGFVLSRLEVDSFTTKRMWPHSNVQVPSVYKKVEIVTCTPDTTVEFKPNTRIYFTKSNEHYTWQYQQPFIGELSKEFPMEFKKGSWYMFAGFPENQVFGSEYTVFVYVETNGRLSDYHVYLKDRAFD